MTRKRTAPPLTLTRVPGLGIAGHDREYQRARRQAARERREV